MEQIHQMLQDGAITQDAYDALIAQSPQQAEESTPAEQDEPDVQRMIQQAVDRATNKLGNRNKELQQRLDRLQKERMTDEEIRQSELEEKERLIAEREQALRDKEHRLYAVKAIKEEGLDDGSESCLALVDFVLAHDEEAIASKVKAFGALVKRFVQAEVDRTFQSHGRVPAGSSAATPDNPYCKESMNLTKQMELELHQPALAQQLRAEAGAV